jgi:hypothetical protein
MGARDNFSISEHSNNSALHYLQLSSSSALTLLVNASSAQFTEEYAFK